MQNFANRSIQIDYLPPVRKFETIDHFWASPQRSTATPGRKSVVIASKLCLDLVGGGASLKGWPMRVGLCVALLAIAILHSIGTQTEAAEAGTVAVPLAIGTSSHVVAAAAPPKSEF
jgi:hypothetical protein